MPQFRAKMDLVPGAVTYFWVTPTRTGEFEILCFELCGVGHHAMRGMVVVEEEDAYQAWVDEHPTFAESMAEARNGTGGESKVVLNEGEAVPEGRALAR